MQVKYQEQVQKFLETPSQKPKIIVIYGPTGAGKTSMSIEIAKYLNTEIISTDSRQIYRAMNIGTGKITREEMQGVPHHMIDIIDPDETYSVGAFKHNAELILDRLYSKNNIPMLVGGTGLYIDSLIFDMQIGGIPQDTDLRREFDELSSEELYRRLQDIDPEYAQEIHPNNRPYIERALEVKILTGKSKRDLRQEKTLKYDVLFLSPTPPQSGILSPLEEKGATGVDVTSSSPPREKNCDEGISGENMKSEIYRKWLYNRINVRVEQMFEEGLEEEVRGLIREGYIEESEGMKAIGYQEFFPYFRGEITRDECKQKIQQHSRNYAKRQITWFSKYEVYKNT